MGNIMNEFAIQVPSNCKLDYVTKRNEDFVKNLISAVKKISLVTVDELPETGVSGTFYAVQKEVPEMVDGKEEMVPKLMIYAWMTDQFILIDSINPETEGQ